MSLILLVIVRWVSVETEVRFTKRVLDVIHQDASIAVEPMLLDVANPMLMYLVVDVRDHSINEEVASMMI